MLKVNVPGESSEDSIDMQQAPTSTNIDNESSESATNLTNLAVENIDDEDRNRSTSIVI